MKNHMKHLLIALLWLALPVLVDAQLTFTTNNDAITITGYIGGGDVDIPATTNGYPVTSIKDFAFDTYENGITSVEIPGSVTSIGEFVFYGCNSLSSITVDPSNPAYSSAGGVLFDEALTTLIQFPEGMGGSYTIPAGVTKIGDNAFSYSGITSVNIPASVTSIGEGAFYGCGGLTSVNIPASVTSIAAQAFENCAGLTGINVDPSNPAYSSAGGVLFDEAQTTLIKYPESLGGSYTIPASVTTIGDAAFIYSGITSVNIPDSVTSIGYNAFDYCVSLTSITIPASVTSIGINAFVFCDNLTSVTIPDSVTSMGDEAFGYCDSLTSAYFRGNAPPDDGTVFDTDTATVYYLPGTTGWGSTFGSVPAVELPLFTSTTNGGAITITGYNGSSGTVDIPATINGYPVTSIAAYAFSATPFASVTIPASVTNIGDYAFAFSDNLTSAYFLGNAPPDDGTVFDTDPATVYYLPGTTGWGSTFGSVPAVLWNPVIQSWGPNFGVDNHQFGFNITCSNNVTVVVEACDDLAGAVWTPLETVTLTDGLYYFTDPNWLNYPSRFYGLGIP